MTRRRAVWVAIGTLGTYLVVVAATIVLSGRHVLPLFEGVGPPPPYHWVHPPPGLAAGNTKPQPASGDIAFNTGGSALGTAFTPDGQLNVNFAAGAFAAHGADTGVHVAITPIDPATLGPVPAGVAPDGNAYRIQLTYEPSGVAVETVAGAANIFMSAPNPAQVLLYSPDGKTWARLPTRTLATTSSLGATITGPGWYLVGGAPVASPPGGSGRVSTIVIAAVVAALAIVLVAVPVWYRSLRRRRSARLPAPRRGQPPEAPRKGHRR